MTETKRPKVNWIDFLWLLFLAGLAALPARDQFHKLLILIGFGGVQLSEGWLVRRMGRRGPAYIVLLKICLATFLLDHTGETVSINSEYYPIYFLPVLTAAEYFAPLRTLFWTALSSAAYSSLLYPALQEYEITREDYEILAIRVLFFFLVAVVVNRYVIESRRLTQQYQETASTLAETNRRLKEAQDEARRSERLAALGQLSAGLAHEIRNPLGVIKGSAEMLKQKLADSNPLATELAGYVYTETNRLSALVTRFLDFARPLHADLTPVDITSVLDRALNDVAQFWKGAPVTVEKQYEANLPLVPLDEGLSEQAFLNLIQNAYDAMAAEGGGKLWVSVARARRDTRDARNVDGVEVRIADSGPGIPSELREQIFNPFVTTKKSGVGLGLSIVSKIIDGHHGSIRIESAAAESAAAGQKSGACFVVFLPAATRTVNATQNEHLVIS